MVARKGPSLVALSLLVAQLTARLAAQCTNPITREPIPGPPGNFFLTTSGVMWDSDGPGPAPARPTISALLDYAVHVWDDASAAWTSFPAPTWGTLVPMPNGDLLLLSRYTTPTLQRWDGSTWGNLGAAVQTGVLGTAVLANGDLLICSAAPILIGGTPFGTLARWDGTAWSSFPNAATPLAAALEAVCVLGNGDVIASGSFGSIGGVTAANIGRWNGTTWAPIGAGIGSAGRHLRALSSNSFAVAGGFLTAGGQPASKVAIWDGAAWQTLAGGLPDVATIAVAANGELFAGGSFSVPTPNIARWDGTAWRGVGGGTSGPVIQLSEGPGETLAIGQFASAGGITVNGLAFWSGSSWSAIGNGPGNYVRASLGTDDGRCVIGGDFTAAGATRCDHIAVSAGDSWQPLAGGGLDASVFALAPLPGGGLVAGGDFTTAGGTPANRVAQWDGTTWSPLGSGTEVRVNVLTVLTNGDIVAGGAFSIAGGIQVNHIARWDGSSWSALGGGTDGDVLALLELPNGDLVAGGSFTQAGGVPANNIARWDGTSWHALGSGTGSHVKALALLPDGDLLVGGSFGFAGGISSPLLARWDGANWSGMGLTGGGLAYVRSILVLPDGGLIVGGKVPWASGYVAAMRLRGTTWSPLLNFDRETMTLTLAGDTLFAGHGPMADGTDPLRFLTRVATTCPPLAEATPTACVGSAGAVTLTAEVLPWIGATFRSRADGFATGAFAVALTGFQSPGTALSALHPAGQPGCFLSASSDAVLPIVPSSGSARFGFAIPIDTGLVGVQLFHQFVQAELAGAQLLSLSTSNPLRLVVGAF